RAAADAAGRRVVRERTRAGPGEGVAGDADGVRAGVDPAAGDPGPILDRLRGSRRCCARPPAAVHGLRRRAARPTVGRLLSPKRWPFGAACRIQYWALTTLQKLRVRRRPRLVEYQPKGSA